MIRVIASAARGPVALAGVAAVAYALYHAVLARRAGVDPAVSVDVPAWLAAGGIGAGALVVGSFWVGRESVTSRRALALMIVAGIAARAIMVSAPVLWETDYFRYLWDGGVTAHGHDPYRFSPEQVRSGADGVPTSLLALSARAGPVLEGVNHPHLTTIYPPVAQAGFAIAHLIRPFDVNAWRGLLLAADLAALGVMLRMLRELGLPGAWASLYWLNPIVLRETYGAAHMEVMAVPLVLGSLLAALRGRPIVGASLLAVAAGLKPWPLVLLPLLVGYARTRRLGALAAGSFALVSAIVWLPMLRFGVGEGSGLRAYVSGWQANDGAFRLLLESLYWAGASWPSAVEAAPLVARVLAGVAVLGCVLRWSVAGAPGGHALVARAGNIVAAVFLLSPTQFPWYYMWVLPFLAFRGRRPLLLYTVLLPLYYVYGREPALLWLEHGPVWAWIVVEWLRPRALTVGAPAPAEVT